MDKKTRKKIEAVMMSADHSQLKNIILNYFEQHPNEKFSYSAARREQMIGEDSRQTAWELNDVVALTLLDSQYRDRVISK